MTNFLIVGAGIAGHRAAIELRRHSADAAITLLGAEGTLPYDRPPLSKDLLLGKVDITQIVLADANRYGELAIDYRPGVSADSLDRAGRKVVCADGSVFPYDKLLLATGSRVNTLPSTLDHPRVRYLRTADDSIALRSELVPGKRLVVIGGGFIGLEVAASACSFGCEVIVIETQDRVLSRGLPRLVSNALHMLHEGKGVSIRTSTNVLSIRDAANGSVEVLTSGGAIEADVVVAGIGIRPNVELALDAGLVVADGIVVDATCKTSDEAIFAAGEVTAHPGSDGRLQRLEAWKVSAEQALVAARAMLGMEASYSTTPWFWSDQFGHNLQVIGAVTDAHSYRLKGDLGGTEWTVVGLNEANLPVGGVALNCGRDISMLRSAISKRAGVPAALAGALVKLVPSEDGLKEDCA